MRLKSLLLVILACLTSSLPGWCASRVFLHNQPLDGRWKGDEFYIPAASVSVYFEPEEAARVVIDPAHQFLKVGAETLALDDESVPVLALARVLGLRRKDSNGVVDIVKPSESSAAVDAPMPTAGRRGEYLDAARYMDRILAGSHPSDDAAGIARIQRIGQKVARVSPLGNIAWKFVLLNDRLPNASCVGEGHVFVTTGLLDLGITDDELAGVLGHEIAHGVRRHGFRRLEMIHELEAFIKDYQRLSQLIAEAPTPSLRGQVDDYERRRVSLQHRLDNSVFYTQVSEEEADVLGLRYAVLAGYSADGLGDCLRQIDKFYENFGMAVSQEGLSHPPVKRRLEILEKARHNGGF